MATCLVMNEEKTKVINGGLKHKPIIYVDYEKLDESDDAKILSIGESQWSQGKTEMDYSAKVFREGTNGAWSRQSEELPLWRVLDLARLVISVILKSDSGMKEQVVTGKEEQKTQLDSFIKNNMKLYTPRIEALKNAIISGQQNMEQANNKIKII